MRHEPSTPNPGTPHPGAASRTSTAPLGTADPTEEAGPAAPGAQRRADPTPGRPRRASGEVVRHPDRAGSGDPELGATTAEYGIVMLAAVGFAGLLVVILKSGEVKELLMGIIRTALSTG